MTTEPRHPLYALTTYELTNRRRELEHAIDGDPGCASGQAQLRKQLDAVLAEQEDRAKLAAYLPDSPRT